MKKSRMLLSAALAGTLLFAGTPVFAEDSTVTVSGSGAMEEAGTPEAVKEIIAVKDAVFTVDEAEKKITTDLDIGTSSRMINLEDMPFTTGYSYYNAMEFFTQVKQVKEVQKQYPAYTVVNENGETVDSTYIADMDELLTKLTAFDQSLSLKYDFEKKGLNVIAENGSAKLEFHIQTNGWWGYDLAGDSIVDKVFGTEGGYFQNMETSEKYGNFFKIDLTEKYEGFYLLKDTDLQNPILIMNDEEAFLVDVDFRGTDVFRSFIKEAVGDRKLYIYITHAHGDHYQNLDCLEIGDVETIYYPEGEPLEGAGVGGTNIEDTFGRWVEAGKIITVRDGEIIERAGKQFEVVQMSNHTDHGSQLIDLTDRILFSGDTLGAQTYKGGTRIALSKVDNWEENLEKSIEVTGVNTGESKYDYVIGGHTGYLNDKNFVNWVKTCVDEVEEKGMSAVTAAPTGTIVVTKDNEIQSSEDILKIFETGQSDEDTTHYASITMKDDMHVSVNRLYNPNSGEHMYTIDSEEASALVDAGWTLENENAWTAPIESDTPVYRLYNANGGEHHYTTDVNEKDALAALGWNDEGIVFYSENEEGTPLYREYDANRFACNHNYTTDQAEHEALIELGWKDEGIAWYASK